MSFLRILRFAFVGFEVRGCGYALVGGMPWLGGMRWLGDLGGRLKRMASKSADVG